VSPGLVRLSVTVSQRDVSCGAEALITVTDSLDQAVGPSLFNARGLPGYTFERAAGALWRSRFDAERNLIVVNSGHRDFVFATRSRTLQLRHLVRLDVKELVLKKLHYRGLPAERLMERLIELSLYVEEKLKTARRVVTDSSATGSGRQFPFHRPDLNATTSPHVSAPCRCTVSTSDRSAAYRRRRSPSFRCCPLHATGWRHVSPLFAPLLSDIASR
jgi:hypothetical protein